ncbi:MAG: bifunctional adenosylcobinamide kinase/adenosylcobinamide-phosphate guanylyltransferase [Chloroflexota bacterium]
MSERFVLVLGGTRSGKSRYGLRRARELAGGAGDGDVVFLGTAMPGDPELADRVRRHRAERPASWRTIDVGLDLAAALEAAGTTTVALVDGLTLWLSAVAGDEPADIDAILDGPFAAVVAVIRSRRGATVVVSDEIGLGMVPLDPVSRRFRDLLGIAHQRLAAEADEVHLMVAGLPLTLKP